MTKLENRINEVWMIWPEDAKRMLSKNYKGNRTISQSMVHRYAKDMKNGNFKDNPYPIVITKNGTLLDGQHRLSAIVEANVPVVLEVRIVPDSSLFVFIDNGKARSVKDFVDGKNNGVIAGLGKFAYCAINGDLGISNTLRGIETIEQINKKQIITTVGRVEVTEYISSHLDGLEAIAAEGKRMYNTVKCGSPLIYSVVLWMIKMFNKEELSDLFVEEFCKPAPDSKPVISGKTTIMKAYSNESKPTHQWMIGTLISIYEAFYGCTDVIRFTNWNRAYQKYDLLLAKWRKNRRENNG